MEGVTAKPPGAGEIDQHQSININGSTQPELKATSAQGNSAQDKQSSSRTKKPDAQEHPAGVDRDGGLPGGRGKHTISA
jgi:hypothetical protein